MSNVVDILKYRKSRGQVPCDHCGFICSLQSAKFMALDSKTRTRKAKTPRVSGRILCPQCEQPVNIHVLDKYTSIRGEQLLLQVPVDELKRYLSLKAPQASCDADAFFANWGQMVSEKIEAWQKVQGEERHLCPDNGSR